MGQEIQQNETNPGSMIVSNYSRSYAAKILEILIKANAGRNEPTKKERQSQIAIFLEVLYGHVPEKRLNDCYVHLMRNRSSTFPLTPNEICVAWAAIKESEMSQPSQKQLTHGFCEKCNNNGVEIVKEENGYSYARICHHERTEQ